MLNTPCSVEVEVPGLALLLNTLLAEAPGAEYQNSHIEHGTLQPENEMLKNHKAFSSKTRRGQPAGRREPLPN